MSCVSDQEPAESRDADRNWGPDLTDLPNITVHVIMTTAILLSKPTSDLITYR